MATPNDLQIFGVWLPHPETPTWDGNNPTTPRTNQSPVANNNEVVTTVNNDSVIDILANDTDADGTIDATSVVITNDVDNGSTAINPTTGVVTYTPTTDYDGPDEFTYTVDDNEGATSNVATVSITVNTPAGVTEITREANRTSGTAPLSVVFVAGFNNSSVSERDFHDLVYLWDFDDTGAGTWANSGKSKETATGPVASHLFESAGTFTVALTIKNGSPPYATVDTDTFEITVTAADTTFSTTNTTVVNKVGDSDFTGKPTGATELNTDDAGDISGILASGKRVLFKRGSEWTQASEINFGNFTTCEIGAYGTGTSPDALGAFDNDPIINITGNDANLFDVERMHDMRITHIQCPGSTITKGIIWGHTDIQNLLMLRCKMTSHKSCLGWTSFREDADDEITGNSVIECSMTDPEVYGNYLGGDKLTYMGNRANDSKTTHVCRAWMAYLSVISHNRLSGASTENTNGRHALKMHGPIDSNVGTYAETGSGGLPFPTKFTVIANNTIGGSGPWSMSLGPQSAGAQYDERLSDIIVEKNIFLADYGTLVPSKLVQVSLMFEGRYFTVRNNVFVGTGGASSYTGVAIERRSTEPTPLGNHVYNNTIYNSDLITGSMTGVSVDSTAADTVIKNIFASFPDDSSETLIIDNSGTAVTSNNQMNNTNGFTDPDNVTPLSRDFSLTAGAPAIDAGTDVAVYDDFDDVVRSGTFEQGAYNFVP